MISRSFFPHYCCCCFAMLVIFFFNEHRVMYRTICNMLHDLSTFKIMFSFLYTNCVINAFQHNISGVIFYRKSTFSEQRIINGCELPLYKSTFSFVCVVLFCFYRYFIYFYRLIDFIGAKINFLLNHSIEYKTNDYIIAELMHILKETRKGLPSSNTNIDK